MAMNKVFLIFLLFVFSLCGTAQKKESKDGLASDSIYIVVEQMPSFPGGEAEMLKYIGTNLKYPEEDREMGIQGRVVVRFVVGSDGVIRNAELIRGRGSALDSTFLKLVQDMPKWNPGMHEGKAVPVSFTFPLMVRPR